MIPTLEAAANIGSKEARFRICSKSDLILFGNLRHQAEATLRWKMRNDSSHRQNDKYNSIPVSKELIEAYVIGYLMTMQKNVANRNCCLTI